MKYTQEGKKRQMAHVNQQNEVEVYEVHVCYWVKASSPKEALDNIAKNFYKQAKVFVGQQLMGMETDSPNEL